MRAKIVRREKSPMQSGKGQVAVWRLSFECESPKQAEPLMGWTSTKDTLPQVHLDFPSRAGAVAYAQRRGLCFTVVEPTPMATVSKAYGENYSSERKIPWSH